MVEEVVHLVEAEEDLAGVADEEDDDDSDEHEGYAAVPATPECRGGVRRRRRTKVGFHKTIYYSLQTASEAKFDLRFDISDFN